MPQSSLIPSSSCAILCDFADLPGALAVVSTLFFATKKSVTSDFDVCDDVVCAAVVSVAAAFVRWVFLATSGDLDM